jgi:hypothetical protein
MSDLYSIYLAEPRLRRIEALLESVARRDGQIPWEDVQHLLRPFLGTRRDVSVIAPRINEVERVLPQLRDEATLARVGHRLHDRTASVDATRPSRKPVA